MNAKEILKIIKDLRPNFRDYGKSSVAFASSFSVIGFEVSGAHNSFDLIFFVDSMIWPPGESLVLRHNLFDSRGFELSVSKFARLDRAVIQISDAIALMPSFLLSNSDEACFIDGLTELICGKKFIWNKADALNFISDVAIFQEKSISGACNLINACMGLSGDDRNYVIARFSEGEFPERLAVMTQNHIKRMASAKISKLVD